MLPNLFKKDVSVSRKLPGSYVDGIWIDGETINFTIRASVQPILGGEMLNTLPEGYREKDTHIIYSDTQLYTASDGVTTPDIVNLNGKQYLVDRVSNWDCNALAHFEIYVVESESDVAV